MSDTNNGAPQALDVDEVLPRASSRPRWRSHPRGRTWPYALLGAASSVAIVAVMMVMSLGDKYDENEVRPALTSFPAFWVCAALLILVQVGVLVRAIYVRSPAWVAVALAGLAFAFLALWPSVTS